MGCDIHLYVEKRVDGCWISTDEWVRENSDGDDSIEVPYEKLYYKERNYFLFSMLASVRNYDDIVPIHAPRGLPADASAEVRECSEQWSGDGHSHSWATVTELISYDWTQEATTTGVVDPENWARWLERGSPQSWAKSVGGGTVRILTHEQFTSAWHQLCLDNKLDVYSRSMPYTEMTRRDNGEAKMRLFVSMLGGGSPYCSVSWNKSYYELAGKFLSETMPRLWQLGAPDDVRIVYWFDN